MKGLDHGNSRFTGKFTRAQGHAWSARGRGGPGGAEPGARQWRAGRIVGDRRQAAAGWPRRSGQILDRQWPEPADHGRAIAGRCWAATLSSSWPPSSTFRSTSSPRCWRSNCRPRSTTPARTASCRIPPDRRNRGWRLGLRGVSPADPVGSLVYRTEKPAKLQHLPCPDVAGFSGRAVCYVDAGFSSPADASGTVSSADYLG